MAFEHPSPVGVVRLHYRAGSWLLLFGGRRSKGWKSPDEAAKAAARHRTGLADWDRRRAPVSDDLLDWRPLGDSI